MNEFLLSLVRKYKSKGLLIDTNVALLYIIGSVELSLIRNFKRTSSFSEEDFEKLSKFIEFFDIRITTPHILTEISNFFGNRTYLHVALAQYIKRSKEIYLTSDAISISTAFLDFGLTDACIYEVARERTYAVLTEDIRLQEYLRKVKTDVVSLHDVRAI